jgi:hypothetical protein
MPILAMLIRCNIVFLNDITLHRHHHCLHFKPECPTNLVSICDICFYTFCFYFSGFFWFLRERQWVFVSAAPRMQQEEVEAEVDDVGACKIVFCNGDPIFL